MRFKVIPVLAMCSLLAACGSEPQPPAQGQTPTLVRCSEQPLPEFTLGVGTQIDASTQNALCSCIWGRLGPRDRQIAEAASQERDPRASRAEISAFTETFGASMHACGGMDL
jgi:hypothetical protein